MPPSLELSGTHSGGACSLLLYLHVPKTGGTSVIEVFKKLPRRMVDQTLAANVQATLPPMLTEAQKILIMREAWEQAFGVVEMETSWSRCGFSRHPIHGCTVILHTCVLGCVTH